MDAAQKAKLDEQQRTRQLINQAISARIGSTGSLERVVGELARTVDRLQDEMVALNARIQTLERRA